MLFQLSCLNVAAYLRKPLNIDFNAFAAHVGIAKSSLMVQAQVELDMSMGEEWQVLYRQDRACTDHAGTQFAQTIEEENLEAA